MRNICLDSPVIPTHPFKNKFSLIAHMGKQHKSLRGANLEFYLTFFFSLIWVEEREKTSSCEIGSA